MSTTVYGSEPIAILRAPGDQITFTSSIDNDGHIINTWPGVTLLGASAILLCIDTWGGGGAGGFGIYAQPPLIGGGGGSGNFNRTYIQLFPNSSLLSRIHNRMTTINIMYNGFVAYTESTVFPISIPSQSGTLLVPIVNTGGGDYTPALPRAIQAVAGNAGAGMSAQSVVSPDENVIAGSNTMLFDVGGDNYEFPSGYITAPCIIIAGSANVNPINLPGVDGQSGVMGGLGAPGTVAGGYVAGWGGDGSGRDKNGVATNVACGPMTVVYLIASARVVSAGGGGGPGDTLHGGIDVAV